MRDRKKNIFKKKRKYKSKYLTNEIISFIFEIKKKFKRGLGIRLVSY